MANDVTETTEHLDTEEQREFRLRARAYLAEHLPPRLPDEPILDWDDTELAAKDRRIQRALWDGGFAGITVPVEYGGQGLGARFEEIFLEEAQPYRLPWAFGNSYNIVIPVLLECGSDYLKRRFIPKILDGDEMWCQLLSEPSGGSDLAGLLTRAVRDGDSWILNGSKVWTTGGNACDYGICLARTDPDVPKHAGLTMFAVDMHQPGITIVPLKLVDGGGDFCQEYLDDVVVPAENVIGEVNDGWRVTTIHLMHERAGVARGWHYGVGRSAAAQHVELSQDVVELLRESGRADDPHARQLAAEVWVLDALMSLTSQRIGARIGSGQVPGYAAALPKLMTGKIGERRTALLSELAGPAGVAAGGDGVSALPGVRRAGITRVTSHNIGGGTGEMQANAVAERMLGLPREPSVDRELPFSQLLHNTVPGGPRSQA